ncbi:hypothetical protein NMD1_00973 [Novosphingobium sp. MD-1]|nr:hypothetical protein NMD1_00973 [Novosphingobium sp. MD-1]
MTQTSVRPGMLSRPFSDTGPPTDLRRSTPVPDCLRFSPCRPGCLPRRRLSRIDGYDRGARFDKAR